MKIILLAMMVILLSGCAGRGPLSGAVDGEVMFRVQETGVGASFNPWAKGDIGGCRVETTESPIEGSLSVEYIGTHCSVRYDR